MGDFNIFWRLFIYFLLGVAFIKGMKYAISHISEARDKVKAKVTGKGATEPKAKAQKAEVEQTSQVDAKDSSRESENG